MNTHYWQTDDPHADNSETMQDYLDNEMDQSWEVIRVCFTYAEVLTDCGEFYGLSASGDGDFSHHMVEFRKLIEPLVFEE